MMFIIIILCACYASYIYCMQTTINKSLRTTTFHETTIIHSFHNSEKHSFEKLDVPEFYSSNQSNNFVFNLIYKNNKYVPDLTDKTNILNMAYMSLNAYYDQNHEDWVPIDGYYNNLSYGWDSDGIQGHLFVSTDDKIIIMTFKGTSITGETAESDKYMDNVMFSCCCAKVNQRWDSVCDCYNLENRSCSNNCLKYHVNNTEISYLNDAIIIYEYVKSIYSDYDIWTSGHSLGGATSSLLAVKYDLFSMTFGSPGDIMYGSRLDIINQTKDYNIYHYASESDPIFNGNCNGRTSGCNVIGYALETKCHTGFVCVYPSDSFETVIEHQIEHIIDDHIKIQDPPECVKQLNCQECTNWIFY
jgi:lipase ATG15